MKRLFLAAALMVAGIGLVGCQDDAQVAAHNVRKAADNFEVVRRVVFYNGISGEYMLVIEGRCSQEAEPRKLAVICKDGPNTFKRHILGLSDNVTYFSEQMESIPANVNHYRVTFKPQVILPHIDLRGGSPLTSQQR